MKKKICFIILTVCFSMLCAINVLAGDTPESIVTDEKTDVIIGTITKIDDKKTTIEISKAMFETIDSKEIELDNFKYLSGIEENQTPAVGDYCAVAVVREKEGFSIFERLCARADSLDAETLKLAEGFAFTSRMNEYINNGNYSKANRIEAISKLDPSELDSEPDTPQGPSFNASIVGSEPETAAATDAGPFAGYINNKWFLIFFMVVFGGTFIVLFFMSNEKTEPKTKKRK